MSQFTQARRWAVLEKYQGRSVGEHAIKPDEARTALLAILAQLGLTLEEITEYDPRGERFHCEARDQDGALHYVLVRDERVGQVVLAARLMSGSHKPLLRPSELQAILDGNAEA